MIPCIYLIFGHSSYVGKSLPLLSAPKTRVCKLEVARQKKSFFGRWFKIFTLFIRTCYLYIYFYHPSMYQATFSIIYINITITYYSVNWKMLDVMNVATLCIDPERDQERFRRDKGGGYVPEGLCTWRGEGG